MGVGGQLHALATLAPRKELQYPLDRLGGTRADMDFMAKRKILPCQEFNPIVQPVA
jgi:hypothetical protein